MNKYFNFLKNKCNEKKQIKEYKSQIRLLQKNVEELTREPQLLIDKMNIMKIEIRELKLQIKEMQQNERYISKEK